MRGKPQVTQVGNEWKMFPTPKGGVMVLIVATRQLESLQLGTLFFYLYQYRKGK